ncbi:putative multidrug resistance protein fnx1 [Dioszegia hungarica]|uniref:Multidrug resistance protein fnx1 n=1 Tax=Dioszegia hungarica TaxID=4972 RepID=A0AA38LW71_9TREE|nr:putative multidrug resistance protein fnx1 [Dioszegia hungarica]KAI9638085.1 putative multidrug resistance protein fnx1 [Dioszegia hungarica]
MSSISRTERDPLLARASEELETQHHNLAGYTPLRFRLTCASIWACTFLASFDSTVLATLTSTISSHFGAADRGSWLGTAYLLSICCFTPIYGRLADILGRRAAHLIALTFFTLGTALCAFAPSMNTLIAAQLIAGVGGGGVQSMAVIVLTDLVDLRHRGLFQGYGNIVFGLGGALGGPVGGWIADTFGWRVAFMIQVPMLMAGAAVAWVCLRGDLGGVEARRKASEGGTATGQSLGKKLRQIDYLGSLTLVGAVASLILGLSLKTSGHTPSNGEYAWTHPYVLTLLISSLVFTFLFIFVEARFAAFPLLPLSLLSRRTPAAVAFSLFVLSTNQFSLLYNVPLFFTAVRGTSASVAGAHLLPYSAMIGIGSLAVGYLIRQTGKYWTLDVGSGVIVLVSALALTFWNQQSPGWLLWTAQVPAGFGYAGVLTGTLVALMTDVQLEGKGEVAVATSMSYLFRSTGQVLGVSLSSALIQSILTHDLPLHITGPASAEIIAKIRRDTESIRYLPPAEQGAARDVYAKALRWVFVVNVVLAAVGVLGLWAVKEEVMPEGNKKGRRGEGDEEGQEGVARE